jgi:hypothetical protein
MEDGIEILTVYAFSTENWSREQHEVTTLMLIISKYADSFKQEAKTRNVRVKVLATGAALFLLLCLLLLRISYTMTSDRFRPPTHEYSGKSSGIRGCHQGVHWLPSQHLLELWWTGRHRYCVQRHRCRCCERRHQRVGHM